MAARAPHALRYLHLPRWRARPGPPAAVRVFAHPAQEWPNRWPRRRPWGQRCRDLCSVGEGNEILRHIAEHDARPFSRTSLDELLQLHELSEEEREAHLRDVLHVGISKIIVLLQDLPLGFGSTPAIRRVIHEYVQDIRDLRASPPGDRESFERCILAIFSRHRGMMKQIGQGLAEFQDELRRGFEPFAGLTPTSCVEAAETVPAIRRVEQVLDEFFTTRTTLRLLIAHCLQLRPESNRHDTGMHDLKLRVPEALRTGRAQARHVGAVCLDTRPSLILIEAFQHAQYMCRRESGRAPQLMVNGVPAQEYLLDLLGDEGPHDIENCFPYIDIHLYFVFFEVLKNALMTSIRKAGPDGVLEPVHASLISGTSLCSQNERTVKITDSGEGIHREDVRKVFSYFYPHASQLHGGLVAPAAAGPSSRPISPPSLGLAVSRVLVRYFGGEIDLHSIPRRGTDVYIYL